MDNALLYNVLRAVALVLGVIFLVWILNDQFFGRDPADIAWEDAERLFEDGSYERAELAFLEILEQDPDHGFALTGLARARHLAGRHEKALATYNEVLSRNPEEASTLANRGILLDTMGRHEQALADYRQALLINPDLADGPSWLTRFLRNQAESPPTIADRARFLEQQFAKPESERTLRIPEIDEAQRPYRQ